jgi:hypothetical protein
MSPQQRGGKTLAQPHFISWESAQLVVQFADGEEVAGKLIEADPEGEWLWLQEEGRETSLFVYTHALRSVRQVHIPAQFKLERGKAAIDTSEPMSMQILTEFQLQIRATYEEWSELRREIALAAGPSSESIRQHLERSDQWCRLTSRLKEDLWLLIELGNVGIPRLAVEEILTFEL